MKGARPASRLVRSLRGGQITIPSEFRKALGIDEQTVLQMTLSEGELRIRPVDIRKTPQGSPWLAELYEQFAPVREEGKMISEEEINAAINEAVASSRTARR